MKKIVRVRKIIMLLISFFLIQTTCNSFQESNVATIENNQPETKSTHNENIFTAKVIRIIDADTLEVLYGELPVMIRLAHIDCPETIGRQPFGKQAKQALPDLCFGNEI